MGDDGFGDMGHIHTPILPVSRPTLSKKQLAFKHRTNHEREVRLAKRAKREKRG